MIPNVHYACRISPHDIVSLWIVVRLLFLTGLLFSAYLSEFLNSLIDGKLVESSGILSKDLLLYIPSASTSGLEKAPCYEDEKMPCNKCKIPLLFVIYLGIYISTGSQILGLDFLRKPKDLVISFT